METNTSDVIPWLQNAGALSNIAGTGFSAYGAYQQAQQARKQYEMALRAWNEDQKRQREMDAINEQQRGINNSLNAGQYATAQANDIEDPYIQYARSLGL